MNISFYKNENENGNEPAKKFLLEQTKDIILRIIMKVDELKDTNIPINPTLLKYLEDEIYEIRHVSSGVRIFVIFNKDDTAMVILHIIIKKRQKISLNDIKIYKSRAKSFRAMNTEEY